MTRLHTCKDRFTCRKILAPISVVASVCFHYKAYNWHAMTPDKKKGDGLDKRASLQKFKMYSKHLRK